MNLFLSIHEAFDSFFNLVLYPSERDRFWA